MKKLSKIEPRAIQAIEELGGGKETMIIGYINLLIDAVQELKNEVDLLKDRLHQPHDPSHLISLAQTRYSVAELRSLYQNNQYTEPVNSTDNFLDWLEEQQSTNKQQ